MSGMREYELCREIFNQCSNNQMRDVDFREVETDDPDTFISNLEPRAEIEKEVLADGTLVYRVHSNGLRKRYSFTPV